MSRSPEELMRYALSEAFKATRAVRPNPRVGCALETADGQMILAHHERVGEAHAESGALSLCKEKGLDTRGSRIAVTLEPCSHHGRTPPCADALIAAGVSEVFVAVEDPFPKVRGTGIAKLRAAGIKVEVGILQAKAENLNREWLFAHRHGRAHATLKMATSWDGGWRSSSGASKWITSEEARIKSQELRARVDVIATSLTTVVADNPRFTVRKMDGSLAAHQPKVFILGRDKAAFKLSESQLAKHPGGAEFVEFSSPESFLKECYALGFYDVMIESGPTMAQTFMASGCVDEIWSFSESQFLGGASTLRFPEAFEAGSLPGLLYEISELEQIGATSILSILVPSRGPVQ